ncbi:MAG: hemolytic enterotoxin [Hydrococcus sp. SU_1_0]|nr:hemolytic enterotoxin [Hydrococcus sp. SU_1_0]
MSISIESDLKEILTKIDNRLDKIDQRFEKLETKIDDRFDKVDQRFEKIETKINEIQVSTARLEEKTEGLSQRISSQEFVNRGVLIGLIVAILGGAAKLFGFVGNT